MKKIMLLVGLFLFSAVLASASETLTANGTARAKIITAATLTAVRDLNFGTIIPGASAGTATIANADASSATDVNIKRAAGNVFSAKFTLANMDTSGQHYTVSVPATMSLEGPGDDMAVSGMDVSIDDVSGVASQDIFVGGQLAVPAGQAAGEYSGEFTVTVTY